MTADSSTAVRDKIEEIYRTDSRRIFATLVRLLNDFDLAEEAMHEAFASAMGQWPDAGVPGNPRAWLVSAGRFKAVDAIRRRVRFDASLAHLAERLDQTSQADFERDFQAIEDDRLRLIFTCCHPALTPEAQTALTLREVCGLTTEEIASAFLISVPTLAQRVVRAKTKLKSAKVAFETPPREELHERLGAVLHVIYLVFNEGYAASSGESVTRGDLTVEALRLGRLLVELLPEPEAIGLLALMLLHESRRTARQTPTGDLVLLEDQERSLWNKEQIAEGTALVERALASPGWGVYTLQAAIAAVHARTTRADETDWNEIVLLYDELVRLTRSPVVELNRAVAVAMRDSPAAGLALINELLSRDELTDYHLAHAARADLLRRLGKLDDARTAYLQALALARQAPERRFLEKRLREITERS